MNTKVKVGIASAIVAALVALIVLDQKTTPKDDAAKPGSGGDTTTIVGTNGSAEPAATRLRDPRDEEINSLLKDAQQRFGTAQPKAAESNKGGLKGSEERNEKKIPSPSGEEYVIKERDTVDSIAKAHYGHSSFAPMILAANPGLKANALRVGKAIVLPPKGEKKEEPIIAKDPAPMPVEPKDPVLPPTTKKNDAALATVDGKRIYTVQSGDILSSISSKVYGTSRYYKQIYEANKDQIDDPNTIPVGMKLVMPELPSKTNGGSAGTVATTSPAPVPAGAKVVQVSEGQSLWKIAEKFAVERKIGVHDMIKQIVAANADKLKDENSLLRLGWQLVIPE
jgi:nucleoid-associated protein YgaU